MFPSNFEEAILLLLQISLCKIAYLITLWYVLQISKTFSVRPSGGKGSYAGISTVSKGRKDDAHGTLLLENLANKANA